MGVVADSALAAGGEVTGVIPRALVEREVAHEGLTGLHVVETLHERKALMHELSDAFIALPGGFGTLDKLAEAVTWAQLGIHGKPIGILNVSGYFDTLLAFVGVAVESGFVDGANRGLVRAHTEVSALLAALGCDRRSPGSAALPGEPRLGPDSGADDRDCTRQRVTVLGVRLDCDLVGLALWTVSGDTRYETVQSIASFSCG